MEEKYFEYLKSDRLFGSLGDDLLRKWVRGNGLRAVQMSKGECLMTDGSFNHCLVMVVKGCVTVSKTNASGREAVINYLGEGSVFGMASIFTDREEFPSEMTCRQNCVLLVLPRALIEEAFEENPRFAKEYASLLTEKIHFLNRQLSNYTESDTADKVLRWLSQASCGECEITVPTNMSRLAETLGIGRASLYRAFDRLEREGVIERNRDRITILSPEKLI